MEGYYASCCRAEMKGYDSIRDMKEAIEKKNKKIKRLEKKISDIENSTSLKVGHAITYIPEK